MASTTDTLPKPHLPGKVSLQILVCAVCLGTLYYQVFVGLVDDWINMPDFSHGFLVPVVSLYFAWERRDKLFSTPLAPSSWGLLILVFGIALLLLGRLATEFFTMRFSFLVVLSGVIVSLLGWKHVRILAFPLGFLIFMIPIPSILLQKVTFPMQFFASACAELSLQLVGIPVLREGNVIHLARTSLEVAEACSGIRSLISLLALGTVFAYFTKTVFWQRLVLVLACFPIAIVVNALRVSVTGILAHSYGPSVAEGFFHGFSGYVLFLVAMALLFLLSYGLSLLGNGSPPPEAKPDDPGGTV